MARNSPLKAAEPLDLLRLAAQFTWHCGRDLRVESVSAIGPGCPADVLGALRGKRLDRLAGQALYPAERRLLAGHLESRSDFADSGLTLAADGSRTVHVSLSGAALRDEAGRFAGYQGIGRAGSERPYDALQRQELVTLLQSAEAARDRETHLRRESEALLASLQCLHEPLSLPEKCRAILDTFAPLLDYEAAIIVRRGIHGHLAAVVSTIPDAGGLVWPEEPLIASALAGQASVQDDIAGSIDTAKLPEPLRRHARAALFAPLRIGREHAVLIAFHGRPAAFTEAHIAALRRLGLVAEQAFAAEESKIAIVNASKLATLGEMLSAIVHEVNQPLSIITMTAQNGQLLIDAGKPLEDVSEKLQQIDGQARRAAEIVSAIRTLAHPSRTGTSLGDVALEEVVKGLKVLCQGTLRAKGIALDMDLPTPCRAVRAHASGLEQVLLNLIVNARDAVSERLQREDGKFSGRIALAIEDLADTDRVRIRVSDNGGGIPDDVIERIFDPFFTLKEVGKGTGLGLSICRTLLSEMNATMQVHNDAEGAVFEVDLMAAGG